MTRFFFSSESVAIGHPDKVCDQISDAILDAFLEQDPYSHVACEAMATQGLVFLAGEITSKGRVDYQEVVRNTIHSIGYDDPNMGFDYRSCGVVNSLIKQSPDIALAIRDHKDDHKEQGAGDQGLMFGFACDETEELMPLPIMLSHRLVRALHDHRLDGSLPYLRPDGKAQVTIQYEEGFRPVRIDTIVISAQHQENISHEQIVSDLKEMAKSVLPKDLLCEKTKYYLNPTGRFVIGGPASDCGLTGRKIIVDTYGGMAHHGGGAFSGKDPTKVDRSASYAARYVAKNIVAAKLARRCEVQIAYAIGIAHPLAIKVDTYGTGEIDEETLSEAVSKVFDLTPGGIVQMLDLRRPIYTPTAFGGHFGRSPSECPWEKTDKAKALLRALQTTI